MQPRKMKGLQRFAVARLVGTSARSSFPGSLPSTRPGSGSAFPSGSGGADFVRESAPDPDAAPRLPLQSGPETQVVGPVLAVANTFLVREVQGGMEIIDQHALHERVNLEELRRELRAARAQRTRPKSSERLPIPPVFCFRERTSPDLWEERKVGRAATRSGTKVETTPYKST